MSWVPCLAFLTVALFDGLVNSDVFYAWLIQALLPKTPAGTVIVMDNASFHQRHDSWKRSAPISVRQSFFHLTAPTLTPLKTNGIKPKPSEGDTGVVLMNSFLSIHNMSFYNDLAITIGSFNILWFP